jgi:uncharacterized protein (TIGR02270 family)
MSAVPIVIQQHHEVTVSLRHTRSVLVRAPHPRLNRLARLDERIAASLDGLSLAGGEGERLSRIGLEDPGAGAMFAATVLALESRNTAWLVQLLALAEAEPAARRGLVSAFGWVGAPTLRGITRSLLDSGEPMHRRVGMTACAMHGVDPGASLDEALASMQPEDVAHAPAVAAAIGRIDLLPACLRLLNGVPLEAAFPAARAALLLGDRGSSLQVLQGLSADAEHPSRAEAIDLWLRVVDPQQGHDLLRLLAKEPSMARLLMRAIAAAGDTQFVPWLIRQMHQLPLARKAGETFSMLTGLDLAALDLERKPPEGAEFGPSDDAADGDVALDEDDGLPWPDPQRIEAWWQSRGASFAGGTRHFMGEPVSAAHCLSVLRSGFQRQRAAAAQHLCLLNPGTPLFNVAAPAWRQQRLLTSMAPRS